MNCSILQILGNQTQTEEGERRGKRKEERGREGRWREEGREGRRREEENKRRGRWRKRRGGRRLTSGFHVNPVTW